MSKEFEECPYCKVDVRGIDRHIELRHQEFTLKSFLLDSKVTVFLGIALLVTLILFLAGADPLVFGIHLQILLMAATIAVGGLPLAWHGVEELIEEYHFDVDSLVVLAALGAVFINYWAEAAVLIFLFNVAETLEDYSVFSNRKVLRGLLDLSPSTATVRRGGEEVEVESESVEKGETVIIRPGERIPIDGEVIKGESAVDQAPITGESIPVLKSVGDQVFAGTLNGDGMMEVEVTKKSVDSTLSKIVSLIEEEETSKAETERFINKFAFYYTPAVLVLAASVFIIPAALGLALEEWLYRALVLLVISCPCAFVISTPVTMFSAVTTSAKRGVIIKGGAFIESLRETKTIVFDKTGTLTKGKPEVTDIIPLDEFSESGVLTIASSLEELSLHPLAKPIMERHSELVGGALREVEDFKSLTGMGIKGSIDGEQYALGNPGMFDMEEKAKQLVRELSSQGKTVIVVGENGTPIGLIAVEDTIREGAAQTIKELKSRGIRTVMLTGDNEDTARSVSGALGLDDYMANLMPADKLDAIGEMKEGGKVIMVGDGVNDAPALVKADVGIAMGAAGSDTALEAADMALMENDLSTLIYLLDLSERTMRKVKTNVYSSIGVKAALAVLTFAGLVTLWMAVGIGDMGMSLLVISNALLLGRL